MQHNIEKENFIKKNSIPIVISLVFLIAISYISFFHYQFMFNSDGLSYLRFGEQIISGTGHNVQIINAPMGGPVIYATVNHFIQDGFLTLKLFSIICGTVIVFVSYFIIKNIFNRKIAILGQILIVFSPALQTRAVLATNELLALVLIISSFYFLTKNNLKKTDLIFSAILIGLALDIRFQAIAIFFSVIIFLLIKRSNLRKKSAEIILFSIVVFLLVAPVLVYNHYTHDSFFEGTNINFYNYLETNKSQTTESLNTNQFYTIESNVFIQEYLQNLFFHNPNLVFNFVGENAISIIPIVPFLGIIPILGGFLYLVSDKIDKKSILQSLIIGAITFTVVLIFGDLKLHFFAIIIIPLIFLGIINIRKFEKNVLFMLIVAASTFLVLSVVSLDRADHLFPLWITFSILTSVMLLNGINTILSKIRLSERKIFAVILTIIILIILSNVLFSYKSFEILLYGAEFTSIENEIKKIFQDTGQQEQIGYESKLIGDLLAKEDGIENKYVMARSTIFSYYSDSKYLHSYFHEGIKGDSLISFVTRENWSYSDLKISNVGSYPADRLNQINPIPDYIVYTKYTDEYLNTEGIKYGQASDLLILVDPLNPKIPDNFELLYKSDETETVVYRINWDE